MTSFGDGLTSDFMAPATSCGHDVNISDHCTFNSAVPAGSLGDGARGGSAAEDGAEYNDDKASGEDGG